VQRRSPGLERYVLALALLVPLGVALYAIAQLAGFSISLPSSKAFANVADTPIVVQHPAASQPAPPPTLAAPTATPVPTATLAPTVAPTATAEPKPTAAPLSRTYTVKPGDELKHIAALYNVNIWKIIDANDIPNPDSLRIGQVLHIPDN
jgi:LysM repeat protein